MPVVKRDPPIIRSALHAGAAGVLLSGTDAIGERVVGGDVIHRRRVLVVPVAPAASAIGGHHRTLIGDGEDDVRIVRIDPDALIVVTAGRTTYRAPRGPAVHRPPHHHRRAVDDVGIFGIDGDGGEVAAADASHRPHVLLQSCGRLRTACHVSPMRAAVRGLVKTDLPLTRRDVGVEDVRIARRDSDVGLENRRQSFRKLRPRCPAVGGLEDSHAGVSESLALDEALLLRPQHRVQRVGIARVDQHLVGAGVFVLVEHLLKRATTISGAEHTALGIRTIRVTEDGDEEAVGVGRINRNGRDHLTVFQSELLPRASGVGGLVDAVADRQVGTNNAGACPHIDDVGIRRRNRDRADRSCGLIVEQRHPVGAVISRPPDPAIVEAGVERVGLTRDASRRTRASSAGGTDIAPAHSRKERRLRCDCLRLQRRLFRGACECENEGKSGTRKQSAHSSGSMAWRSEGSRVQGFKGSRVQGFRVQGFGPPRACLGVFVTRRLPARADPRCGPSPILWIGNVSIERSISSSCSRNAD